MAEILSENRRKRAYYILLAITALGSAVGLVATRLREPSDYSLLASLIWSLYMIYRLPRHPLATTDRLAALSVAAFLLANIYMALSRLPTDGLWPSLMWSGLVYPGAFLILPPERAKSFLIRYFAAMVLVSTLAYLSAVTNYGYDFYHLNVHIQWLLTQTAMLILASVIFDLGSRAALAARAEEEARTDPLTGVANRRRFVEILEEELRRARRNGRYPTLILIDVDGLKKVNDVHGHAAGDELLVTVARRISEALRETDLLARIGGDEFAVLLYECGLEEAREIAERVRRSVESNQDRPWPMSLSLGLAEALPEDSLSSLFDRADRALYRAKHRGGNAVVTADA